MDKKLKSILYLYILGDSLGSYNIINNKLMFKVGNKLYIHYSEYFEAIQSFINLGGVNDFNYSGVKSSLETILFLKMLSIMIDNKIKDYDKIIKMLKECFYKIIEDKITNVNNDPLELITGRTTVENTISALSKGLSSSDFEYNPTSSGAGPSSRNIFLGLIFYKDIDSLIKYSITISKFTHNSPMGFLAGLTTPFFITLGINNININEWPYLLIDLLLSDKVKKEVNINNYDEMSDYVKYIDTWKKYISLCFDEKKNRIKNKSDKNFFSRLNFHFRNFNESYMKKGNGDIILGLIGFTGLGAIIMAYDSVLICGGSWERLVYYTMLIPGRTNIIGSISGALYASIYNLKKVPKKSYKKYLKIDLISKIIDKIK